VIGREIRDVEFGSLEPLQNAVLAKQWQVDDDSELVGVIDPRRAESRRPELGFVGGEISAAQ